jgi:DNA-binding beta-propeller fold protein YncE
MRSMKERFRSWVALAGAIISLGSTTGFPAHELLYAVTGVNDLISFYSDAPGTIVSSHAITGLQAAEEIRGLDYSTYDRKLYGLGSSSRLYIIDPASGTATPAGSGQFSPVLNGQSFGVDNTSASFRVVSDLGQSLAIGRLTGSVSQGTALAYRTGDSHFGIRPSISALAYDPASGNYYALDSLQNTLATFNPATGKLSTIGPTGIDISRENGLDISPATGLMYLVSPAASSGPAANLYTVSKSTGMVTLVGLIGQPGDNIVMRGLTVVPP